MKKHLHNSLRALFLSLAVLLSLPMLAVEVMIGGINYELDAETKLATVIAKSSGKYSGEVVIPESVEHEGAAYSVTSIEGYAFTGCSGLTSVTIPNSVKSRGSGAFQDCSGLTSVHISDIAVWCNIDFVDSQANPLCFAHHLYVNGEEVKDLVLPNSVTSIKEQTFYGCSGLTSVTIPNSVASIGKSAFDRCSGLTSVTIGDGVVSIGDYAFWSCSALTSVAIGNSVKSIGEEVFQDCSGLTLVTIPHGVESIGKSAFSGCSGLTSVTIPNSVKNIGSSVFSDCPDLFSIVVEDGNPVYDSRNNSNAVIETATNILIAGCKTTVIPNGVTGIGERAFSGCSGLISVTIPNSVTSMGQNTFSGCSGLLSVTIGNSVTSISRSAFSGCSALTSVTIPNSVTGIERFAFSSCSGLTSVIIGNGVTSMGRYAFGGCSEILDVYCYAENVPSTDSDAFQSSSIADATLHVPATSVESYQVTSPWSGFGKIVALTEEETGIDELKTENCKVKTAVYDLSGRRVQKAQKGVYIQNGKVVMVR